MTPRPSSRGRRATSCSWGDAPPAKAGSSSAHGAPLGADEVEALRRLNVDRAVVVGVDLDDGRAVGVGIGPEVGGDGGEGRGDEEEDAEEHEDAEPACPACGCTKPLKKGKCRDCGLHLG